MNPKSYLTGVKILKIAISKAVDLLHVVKMTTWTPTSAPAKKSHKRMVSVQNLSGEQKNMPMV